MAKEKVEEKVEETTTTEKFIDPMTELIAKMRKEAMKTEVVLITSNDKRDSDSASTVYATCENQYFALAKIIPLNVEVEVEQCLIDVLSEVEIPLHIDEIVKGQKTGVSTYRMIKKFNISKVGKK